MQWSYDSIILRAASAEDSSNAQLSGTGLQLIVDMDSHSVGQTAASQRIRAVVCRPVALDLPEAINRAHAGHKILCTKLKRLRKIGSNKFGFRRAAANSEILS